MTHAPPGLVADARVAHSPSSSSPSSSKMAPRLAVVLLNYRTPDLTLDCLATLADEVDADSSVVVVDNASGDGSSDVLRRAIADRGWSSWARLVRAPANGGFAAGNNLGVAAVDADVYVLLNSDTLVRPGALVALRQALLARPDVGIVGAGLLTADGAADPSCFAVPGPLHEMVRAADAGFISRLYERFSGDDGTVDDGPGWVGFACVAIRRDVFRDVGPLDDGYFMYFEDIDFCRRARVAGWKILHWPDARVVHLLGRSSKLSGGDGRRRRAPRYFYEARARYFAKHYGRRGLWLANSLWWIGRGLSLPRELLGRAPVHREREGVDLWTNAFAPLRRHTGGAA